MRRTLLLLGVNALVFLALLLGLELAGQGVFYLRKGHTMASDLFLFHRQLFEPHPYLVGRLQAGASVRDEDGKVITVTAAHTRWTGAPAQADRLIRVAVLGGSSTFGTKVSDADTWPALLQSALGEKYAVVNFGLPGYSTAEAVIQMALQVPETRPHVVVFYEGWNDLRNYHDPDLGADYYNHGMRQFDSFGIATPAHCETFIQRVRRASALCRLAAKLHRAIAGPPPPTAGEPALAVPDPFVDRIYLRNLQTLKRMAADLPAGAIFIPQVLNQAEFKGGAQARSWSPRIQDRAVPALMAHLNEIMLGLAPADDARCVVMREVLQETWQPDDFVDEGHFSRQGGIKFARLVAARIKALASGQPRL